MQGAGLPQPTSGAARPRKHRASPFILIAVGALLIGLVLGLVLGGIIPSLRPHPAPIQVVVAPEDEATAQDRLMPDVRGLAESDARQALADYGVAPGAITIDRVPHLSPEGFVVAQNPIGGTKNPTTVTLSLPAPAQVPDLSGKDEEAARNALLTMGASTVVVRRYAPGVPAGQVVDSTPRAGEPLTASVEVVVAATPQTAYLSSIRDSGSCSRNNVSVNGTKFENSTTCSAGRGNPRETYWLLNRRTATLKGTVGLDDRSHPEARVRLVIAGDGRELFAGDLAYGQSRPIDVSTADVLRLTVTTERLDDGTSSATAVLGDAVVSGSVEDLATLDLR